jgi:hypothetical protein
MTVGEVPVLPPHAEIANLEHELPVLRASYANYVRAGKVGTYAFYAMLTIAGALLSYAVATGRVDVLTAVFFVGFVSVFSILWMVLFKGVDFSNWQFYDLPYPIYHHMRFLREAIAKREKRLAELKAKS